MNMVEDFTLHVNGSKHTVKSSKFEPNTSLNKYLRDELLLTGTKRMCVEGGCGVCVVTVQRHRPDDGKIETVAVNSCLVPLFQCNGWQIFTIEGLGTSRNIHQIQNILAKWNGTQCGYCTPGMIMNMYCLKQKNPDLKMKDVENSFGGNICRCTGYRPILSAFKSLCSDASPDLLGLCPDIEDLNPCQKAGDSCQGIGGDCRRPRNASPVCFQLKGRSWIKVARLNDLMEVVRTFSEPRNGSGYMIVGGNTASGVYKNIDPLPKVYVDIFDVPELKAIRVEKGGLCLGANVTLADAMRAFLEYSGKSDGLGHLEKLAKHVDLIANVPVRNTGTLAGNLMIKHRHREFPSDIFLILETAEAKLEIVDTNHKSVLVRPSEFLNIDMSGKIISNILLPTLTKDHKYESYKIMPRAQNAHALVNAGFLLKISNTGIVEKAQIVFGCIHSNFVHAKNTETFLLNNKLFSNNTIQGAFRMLDKELLCEYYPAESKPEFRKKLAIALFYKYILSIAPHHLVPKRFKSGATILNRPISSGTQDFETKESLYPLSQPLNKAEAIAQVTGEAKYVMDIPNTPDTLFAAFVLAKSAPNSKIIKIDASKILQKDGVVAFFDKSSIPGKNTFTPMPPSFVIEEELFCDGIVKYYDQPVGVIVATSQELADEASKFVDIIYEKPKVKPCITIKDVIEHGSSDKIIQDKIMEPKNAIQKDKIKNTVKGKFGHQWQYHFHMETQCCAVFPEEDGISIYPASQWMDINQAAAAAVLDIPANKVNVNVRRCGGGFGAKIFRSSLISTACALAAYILRKPVKLWTTIETNMRIIGKRCQVLSNYEIGTDDKGVIQYLKNDFYYDYGKDGGNEAVLFLLLEIYFSTYNSDTWYTNIKTTRTDTHPTAYVRAPGSSEGYGMIESIMEHAAIEIGIDPLEFRIKNIKKDDTTLLNYIKEFVEWAEIHSRKQKIEQFNKDNRWKKKGISVIPLEYPMGIFFSYGVMISIYHVDGTVAVCHGGVEIGQGINTKVIQVCAHKFGIPIEKVVVKPSNNLAAPNSMMTGASITSEAVCLGVIKACDELLERMEPIKAKLEIPTWENVIAECYKEFINLCATSLNRPFKENVDKYTVYAVGAAEVEVDILTGQYLVNRVDILEDVGNSINPAIDIGQVEGAFVMGQGYQTTEQILTNPDGEILTDRTWSYKPPGAKDIPIDFRIKFPKNNPNPVGVLKSKAVGEPPICLATSIPLAIRHAVGSARQEADKKQSKWYPIDGPSTVENTFVNCLPDYTQYTLL